jgi:addiction module HigA family antidote
MDKLIEVEHAGIILKKEFMEPLKVSTYKLTKETGIDQMTLHKIIHGKRSITAKTGLKLSKFFGLSDNYWVNLQVDYDIRIAKTQISEELKLIVPLQA